MTPDDSKSPLRNKLQDLSDRRASFFAAIEVIKAKKIFIIITCSLAMIGTFLGHFAQVPEYSTSSTLFVQALEDPTAAEYLLNQRVGRSTKTDRIDTYMRYLTSDTFFLNVAQKIKFHPDFPTLHFAPAQTQSLMSLSFWKSFLFSQKNNLISSEKLSIEDLEGLIKQITSYDSDYSHFIHIRTKSLDARTSQVVANVIAEEFVSMTNERGLQEIEQVQTFIKEKLVETESRLKTTEIEFIDFKKKNSIISTDTSSSHLADRYTKIASDLESARLQLEENQKLIDYFEKGQKTNIESISQTQGAGGLKETALVLQRKLEQLKKQKSFLLAQEDKSQNWRLQEIEDEIKKTAQAYRYYASKLGSDDIFAYMNPQKIQQKINELKEENEILKNKISTHNKAMSEVKIQVENIPSLAQKQFVFENNLKLENENYTNLKNKLMELEIQRLSHKKEIRIDQMAALPGASAKGSLSLKLLFSFLASVLFGIAIIIGIEAIDPTVKHRSDLNDCGLDFIGDIPLIQDETPEKKSITSSQKLVCLKDPESLESMAFKYVRARIESMRYKFKKEHQVISITSSGVHEGKSLIAANLAVSLSQLKRKTLIIDCDLRRPSQNAYFETSPQYGLVDLLDMKKTLTDVTVKNLHPYLDYMPAGFCTQNSTEYIASERFRALIAFIRDQYDYIVIDTPPAFAAVDAAVIASFSDIPILIANFRDTKKHELHEAYNQLLQVSFKRVFGLINKAIISTTRFHYYGYHGYSQTEKANIGSLSSSNENSSDIQKFIDNLKTKSS